MYIINVIPLTKIPRPHPQILSYFFNQKLPLGSLVQILIRKKKINALVISSEDLEKKKIELKKNFSFELKSIEKVITKNPVLTPAQLKLLFWFSEYYFSSLGLVARLFVPRKLITAKRFRKNYSLSLINKKKLILTPNNKKEIFAAYKQLDSIVIRQADSFKYQSWGRKPYYNAQKVAFQLAKIFKANVDLETTTPTIETYYQAQKKGYNLKIQPYGRKNINTKLIDLRDEIKNKNYSIISKQLQTQLLNSKKSILYISRRGASTFILCRDCGHVLKCPNCDVPLVYHQGPKLICHHCGAEQKPPSVCPNCKGHRIKYFGAGTQKVETEIKKIFSASFSRKKTIEIFRLDSDTAEKPNHQQQIISKFNQAANAVLIGTQMLIDKNINSANLSAIISIETLLNLPDYRSSERVFQIVNKVRGMSKNHFYIQTYNPENFVFKAAVENSWKKLYNKEIEIRKSLNYPPFSQIVKLSFKHKNPKKAEQEAKILFTKLEQQIKSGLKDKESKIDLLGPVPAFIPKVAGKYQWHIIIKNRIRNLKNRNKLLQIIPSNWEVEVDSSSLL